MNEREREQVRERVKRYREKHVTVKDVTPRDVTVLSGMDEHMRRSWEGVARGWVADPEGMRRLIGPIAKKEEGARKDGGDETYVVRWGIWGPTFGEIASVFL